MPMSRSDWERTTWRVAPRLDVPELAPCAVQCALLDADPLPRFRDALDHPSVTLPADVPVDQAAIFRSARRAAGWSSLFRSVSGDRLFLLTDFGPQAGHAPAVPLGAATITLTRAFLCVSSDEPDGRKWLVSTVLHAGSRRLVWSVPFEARRGETVTVTLRLDGAQDLDAQPLAGS
jgi:hypothetical protein